MFRSALSAFRSGPSQPVSQFNGTARYVFLLKIQKFIVLNEVKVLYYCPAFYNIYFIQESCLISRLYGGKIVIFSSDHWLFDFQAGLVNLHMKLYIHQPDQINEGLNHQHGLN